MSVRSRIRAFFRISPPTVVALVVVMTATTILCNAGGAIIDAVVATVAAQAQSGLAARYPGDVGIEQDPAVVFVENFEESTVLAVQNRWTDILNGAAMLFSSDVPSGSPGSHSLVIPSVGGGVNNGGHLYRQLTPGVDDTLYLRYYIKYPTNSNYSHQGIWMGGHNPPVSWPDPQAGTKPVGNDRFSAAAEQLHGSNVFDHYDYWMNMHLSLDGSYWGNRLLNNPAVTGVEGQWMCVEQMVKLNNPVTAFNGEHAFWLNGVKVSHLGQGFPNGTWVGGNFTQGAGTPFEGFRWRSDPALNLNWIWLQNYSPDDPSGVNASMKFDHVVAAKSYIGCLASSTAPRPPAAPTNLRIIANSTIVPVAQVTISPGSATLVRAATQQFTATLKDASGNVLTGRSISWGSSNLAAATVNGTGLVTAVGAGSASILATSEGKTATAAVTVSNPSSGGWPNEPSGLTLFNDQPWDLLNGANWNWARRTASKDPTITVDTTAPFSAVNALKMIFTPDMQRDSEPSVHWISLPGIKEIYTAWWMKVSPNWTCSPAGCGKITFLFTNGAGQVYSNLYSAGSGGPPFRIGSNTEWAPYGQFIRYPNVTTTVVDVGQWHRVEFYYRWETTPGSSGDGIIRWWVDGVLNGNYTDVHYPASSFAEFQFAPTLQNPPPAEQYMYIDHTHVSRR
jgi:hypothetical protein